MAVVVAVMVEFDAEEVFDGTFEVDVEVGFGVDEGFEFSFYVVAFAEVDEVIDVQSDVDGRLARDESAGEYARGVWEGIETDGLEGFCCCFVPVAGAAFESIEGSAEEEVSIWWGDWASWWWFADVFFVFWEEALAKGLDEVS